MVLISFQDFSVSHHLNQQTGHKLKRVFNGVADAKKAGIHPLAALGMPTVSGTTFNAADNNLSNAVGAAGESAIRYHMLKNENQKILNDTAETAARDRDWET